jgi:hypothetical protein
MSAELAVRERRIASALVVLLLLLSVTLVSALSFAAGVYLDVGEDETAPTPVLVANRTIEAGTSGMIVAREQMYTATTIPKKEVLEGAIADPTFLRGRAAAVQILPGKQLTATDFHP